VSQLLTLYITPNYFVYIENAHGLFARRKAKRMAHAAAPAPAALEPATSDYGK
jgi:hypothetical protein